MSAPTQTTTGPRILYLKAAATIAAAAEQAGAGAGVRRFAGTAYSGAVLARDWGPPIILDLATMTWPSPCPALESHERERRVGVAELATDGRVLTTQGRLLGNPGARAIAADADDGFPWQMSVHAEAGSVETLAAGKDVTVNGQRVSGPLAIWRGVKIREVSFTPTGVDDATSAAVLQHAYPTSEHIEDSPMPPEPTGTQAATQSPQSTEQAADLVAQLAAMTTRAEQAEAKLAALPGSEVVADLQRQIAELSASAERRERDDLLLAAEADGRLTPGTKLHEHAAGLALAPLQALVASLTPVAALAGSQTRGVPPAGTAAEGGGEFTAQLKAEFGSKEAWEAYEEAQGRGLIKIYGDNA